MTGLHELTIHEAHRRLAAREISSVELTQDCLDRIHQVEDRVRSFLAITEELALDQARQADQRIAGGFAAALAGIEQMGDGPDVVLRADRALDYGRVMAIMGELNRAGLNRISLVTGRSSDAP